jgi:hypothetical protein
LMLREISKIVNGSISSVTGTHLQAIFALLPCDPIQIVDAGASPKRETSSGHMFNALPAPILLDIAILFTALSWGVGFYVADRTAHVFASLAIGCFVCLLGYSVASLGAPVWVVIAAPVPLDLLLLWYVLRTPRKMVIAYPTIWLIYIVMHVVLSAFFRYDSLIPAWRLHS